MKCRDFGSVLRTFADVLDVAGAPLARDQIAMFADAIDAHPTRNVSDLVKSVAAFPVTESAGSPRLGEVARVLSALKGFLNKTAKAAVLNDVNTVEKLLHDRASMEFSAFVRMAKEATTAPRSTRKKDALGARGLDKAASETRRSARKKDPPQVRDDLVTYYKQKLEAALGDEETFTAIYDDLRANPAMGKPEMTALAKQMTGSGARSQEAALKKIWNRHQSLVLFKAKSRATGGRSAA